MGLGHYYELRAFLKCDAVGCRTFIYVDEPLPANAKPWMQELVTVNGIDDQAVALCPDHSKELNRLVDREMKSAGMGRHRTYDVYIYIYLYVCDIYIYMCVCITPSPYAYVIYYVGCVVLDRDRTGHEWSTQREQGVRDTLDSDTKGHELNIMCGRCFFKNVGNE